MGCSVLSKLIQKNTPAATDCEERHCTDLNKKQRFLLKCSWKGVAREMERAGTVVLSELMNSNQELLQCFQVLQDERREEIISILMEDIDSIIFHLEEQDTISNILHKIWGNFQKIAGFSGETFEHFQEPFLTGVSQVLDERYSVHMEEIYKVFIRFIISSFVSIGEEKKL